MSAFYLQVTILTPLYRVFDYLPPEAVSRADCHSGARVRVPFGQREVIGILLGTSDQSTYSAAKLKQAVALIDDAPLIDAGLLQLMQWSAEYYHEAIGEVVCGMLPKRVRQGKRDDAEPGAIEGLSDIAKASALNEEQQAAFDAINTATGFGVHVLQGVTGSGKTEVYMQLIAAVLARGEQALLLVPEIGLTPQMLQRFEARFQVPIAVLHSGLTDKQRAEFWWQAKQGIARIVIGTRSAAFVPLQQLGLIVIDEEHDQSFKQQTRFRYHARDVLIKRAQLVDRPIIMGSATPSLESLYNVQQGRYHCYYLSRRAGAAKPPVVSLVNLRDQRRRSGMTNCLVQKIKETLARDQQVMVFINRRGYAPVVMCHHCSWIAHCHRCEAKLTYHAETKKLHCHHCDNVSRLIEECPECQKDDMIVVGVGTERVEEGLQALFPDKMVLRIDRDSTRKKGSFDDMLEKIQSGEAQILIGTQMLSKGHHFPRLGLVAVLDADQGLFSIDFRAIEHLGQQIVQVAGRSGREALIGEVLIQTHQPEHPLLKILIEKGYAAFAQVLLDERHHTNLPPYSYRVELNASAHRVEDCFHFLSEAKALLPSAHQIDVLGPFKAELRKVASMYQNKLLLQCHDRRHLHQVLKAWVPAVAALKGARRVRWGIDVDPV